MEKMPKTALGILYFHSTRGEHLEVPMPDVHNRNFTHTPKSVTKSATSQFPDISGQTMGQTNVMTENVAL